MSDEAHPDCRICRGAGQFEDRQPNGMIYYRICQCVLTTRRLRAAQMRIDRHIGPRAKRYTLDRYSPGASKRNELALRVARNFCDRWPEARAAGWMLGFYGEPGCGKTHLATGIAVEVMWRFGATGKVVSVPELLRAERASFRNPEATSPISRAAEYDILVLDDIGAEYLRSRADARSDVDWVDEQLYLLLDARLLENRPTIYTTNLAPADLAKVLSERVASRIEREQVMAPIRMQRVEQMSLRDPSIGDSLTAPRPNRSPRQ